jgi:hypothetical protein
VNGQYEVLSPWADVDPIPLRGIAPRVTDLAGKKVGLFRNSKRAAKPSLAIVEEKLKARFPSCEISSYAFMPNAGITETEEWTTKYEDWLKEVDAVILSYGD